MVNEATKADASRRDAAGLDWRAGWWSRIALAVVATAVTLGISELALRWTDPYGLFEAGAELQWMRESRRDLTREYLKLHQTFGYSPAELAGLALAGLRQAFLDDDKRVGLEDEFRQQIAKLSEQHLGERLELT